MAKTKLEWEAVNPPLPEALLRAAETILGVTFPPDYRSLVRVYHGGSPEPSSFDVSFPTNPYRSCVGILLTPDPRLPESIFSYIANLSEDDQLPEGLVPIADDGGGDLVCLDYRGLKRSSGVEPSVVYWAHELTGPEAICPLAKSFGTFLRLLGPE